MKPKSKKKKKGIKIPMTLVKRCVYDSVFTNLFKDKKYTIQLYRALHPEDTTTSENDLEIVTLKNVLLNQPYNDLGFIVGNRLLLLVEAQSTWSVNIVVRAFLYVAQTIQEHLIKTKQRVYGQHKVIIPEPELYVIYTGKMDSLLSTQESVPTKISLNAEFFDGKSECMDVVAKILYNGKEGDIINQYVKFTQIYKEQVKQHGATIRAVQETIRICKDKDVLAEYLESREGEVYRIMNYLYNTRLHLGYYVEDECRKAAAEANARANQAIEAKNQAIARANQAIEAKNQAIARANQAIEAEQQTAKNLHKKGLSIDEIAEIMNCTTRHVQDMLNT